MWALYHSILGNRRIRLLSTTLVILLILTTFFSTKPGGAKPAYAATIVVNSLADVDNDWDGICTLRQAIRIANFFAFASDCGPSLDDADTITFSVDGTITLTSELPAITSPITIEGSGRNVVIDGAGNYQVFLNSGHLTINKLTIQHGRADIGGGIDNDSGTVTVTNSTFANNTANFYGGGIATSHGGTMTVTNSTFTDNTATQYGGGIYNLNATLTVTNSTFFDNHADNSGGGIYNKFGASPGRLTVTNSTFADNSAQYGGGIYNMSVLTVTNSTFANNTAAQSGGGIYNSATAHLAGNIFQQGSSGGNCTGSVTDEGYNLSGDGSCGFSATGSANNVSNLNLGPLSGGGPGQQVRTPQSGSAAIGVIPNGTSINNNGVTLACNSTTQDQLGQTRPITSGTSCTAGAVEVIPPCPLPATVSTQGWLTLCIAAANANGASPDTITLAAHIILNETLPAISTPITLEGAGYIVDGVNSYRVFEVTSSGNFTVHNLTIQHGYAGGGGGGIYNNGGTLTATGSTFMDNSASIGGGIYNLGGTLTVTGSTFASNTTSGNGGGIANTSALTVTSSTFFNNHADGSGGSINNTGVLTMTASSFSYNAASSGGSINNSGTVHLAGNIFQKGDSGSNCQGSVTDHGYNLSSDTTCVSGGTGSLTNATLYLGLLSGSGPGQQVTPPEGGSDAIWAIPNGTSINNNGVTLTCNGTMTDQLGQLRPFISSVKCTAGAVEISPECPLPATVNDQFGLEKCIITANTNGASRDTITLAADMTLFEALPTISTPITLEGAGHFVDGAGSYRVFEVLGSGQFTVNQLTIRHGNAGSSNGGGIAIYYGGKLTVTNSTFANNTAPSPSAYGGGGIYAYGGTVTVTNSTFDTNTTLGVYGGGGIYNVNGTLTVTNSTFANNTTNACGGGIYNLNGTLTVTGSTFSGNQATAASCGYGGGIYNNNSTLTVTNSTFSANTASQRGGGIYNGGTLKVTHSTFANNSAPNGGGIYLASTATYLAGDIFQKGGSGSNCAGSVTDNGYNLSSDTTCISGGTGSLTNATLNLGTLANNGGLTQTHLPGAGSMAIDRIPTGTTINNNGVTYTCNQNGESLDTDQRSSARPVNAGEHCDAGAVEAADVPLTFTIDDVSVTEGDSNTVNAIFTVTLNTVNHVPVTVQYDTDPGGANPATEDVDYTATSGTLTFAPDGPLTQTISVPVLGDTLDEFDETFIVTLSSPTNATIADNQGIGTILDNDDMTALLSIDDVTITEGDSGEVNAVFTVTMSTGSGKTVTVQYATADGTATAGSDYTATSGTLTFSPGEALTQTISVPVIVDWLCEDDETFTVTLSNPLNANLGDDQGIGTIVDDDVCELVLVSPSDGALTNDNTPTFIWQAVPEADTYHIQIDDTADFDPPLTAEAVVSPATYTPEVVLADNTTYYWRVLGLKGEQPGPWSDVWTVRTDIARLRAPLLSLPKDRTNTPDKTPTFSWGAVTGAKGYQIQVDSDLAFTVGPVDTTVATYTSPELPYGVYYWRVRARDAAGNWSDWSLTRTVTITVLSTPTNAQHLTDTTPAFVWKAVTGATNYHLEVCDEETLSHVVFAKDTTGLSATPGASEALASGQHWWRVRVDRSGGVQEWTPVWTFTITPAVPAAPPLTLPTGGWLTNNNTPDFTWGSTPTVAGSPFAYQIQIDNQSTFTSPEQDVRLGPDVLAYTAAPLPDKVYYWRVRAINNVDAAGSWSVPRAFTVDTTPPPAPKLLAPADWSGTTDTTPTFTWAAVTGAKWYTLEFFTGTDCASPLPAISNRTGTTYTLTLAQALPYDHVCWRMSAGDAAGNWGAPGPFFHLTVNSTAMPKPAAPLLSGPLANTFWTSTTLPPFTWTMAGTGHTFQVQIDNQSTFASPERDVLTPVDELTYTADSLADAKYYWRVRAINSSNVAGPWSLVRAFTLDNLPPAAPILTAPANNAFITVVRPTLTWKAVAGAKQIVVQVATDAGFTDLRVNKTLGPAAVSYPLTAAEALSYGATYYWRVQAVDAAGNASPWSTAQFTVTLHKTPTNGAATTVVRPTFSWVAVTGATYWLQVATTPDFIPLGLVVDGTMNARTSYTLPLSMPALTSDTYYWRVGLTLGGVDTWMPAWTFIVTPPKPAQVVLLAPAGGALTNDSTPTLTWKDVTVAAHYQVQIDNQSTFASPEQDVIVGSELESFIASDLPDGVYSWRVRALNSVEAAGAWSYPRTFTVDTLPPAAPALVAPLDTASSTNAKLVLSWAAVTGAARYQVQLEPASSAFGLPVVDAGTITTYKPPTPLSRDIYAWHVRALDKTGNVSAWSETRSFTIVAGVTSALLPTQPAVPTVEPTETPTTEPTLEPTATPDSSLTVIESDDAAVKQTGIWTAHDTPYASGGRYLFSSGSPDDALLLTFTGSRVDIVYVKHPALGVVVVEVDGVPLQLVDSIASDSEFGARTTASVSPGQHTLRVYPMTGTIAIDAFVVEPQVLPSTPVVEPTGQPTEVVPPAETPAPTTEATGEVLPTAEPTLPPPPTDEVLPTPTAGALPVPLPVVETFDSGTGWQPTGAWRFDPQTAYRGAGWFANGALRDQSSTLTAQGQIDLRTALNPELTFWQRASLASADAMAVDLSLDGGLTWFPVDQQVGTSFDWTSRTVSLGMYRGAVVALRFRLGTPGGLPENVASAGWWIDELVVQDPPVVPPTPIPTELPTITPLPTATPTELPTATPLPTETPLPTATPTETPTIIPSPTETPMPTEVPTEVTVVTDTPVP
jgi:CSLREA domain-containing protein